jgi:hypothetical protein
MSISALRRPSSVARDPDDRTARASADVPSERRTFPGWRGMAVWPAFPIAGLIGWKIGGRVDAVDAALVGGALTQAAGTRPRLRVTPAWQMRALGLVNRTVREISEMRYEFDEPFIVDASRAESELGLRATPLADAVEQTVRWYRAQANPASAAGRGRTRHVAPGSEPR